MYFTWESSQENNVISKPKSKEVLSNFSFPLFGYLYGILKEKDPKAIKEIKASKAIMQLSKYTCYYQALRFQCRQEIGAAHFPKRRREEACVT